MSITIKQAINEFLLSCKVEGKSYGTIECYSDKLKGFLWYTNNYNWPDDISLITTNHLREFLAYLRDTPHRFNSTCPRAMKPINSTTVQKYYRALSALFNWSLNEGIISSNPLIKIKVPRAEKKVIKALSSNEVNQLLSVLENTFDGIRNKAMILVLIDCGLRLGELLNIKTSDINMEQQLMKVDGKTGERIVRYGLTSAKALKQYLKFRNKINGHNESLWLTEKGMVYKDDAGNVVVMGARFMENIQLHIGLFDGDVEKCLKFAQVKGAEKGVTSMHCLYPDELSGIEKSLLDYGFEMEPSPFIVMEINL